MMFGYAGKKKSIYFKCSKKCLRCICMYSVTVMPNNSITQDIETCKWSGWKNKQKQPESKGNVDGETGSHTEGKSLRTLSMMLAEMFAKHPAVTAYEETELLTETGTHSSALVRYSEGKSEVLHKHPAHSSLSNSKTASGPSNLLL